MIQQRGPAAKFWAGDLGLSSAARRWLPMSVANWVSGRAIDALGMPIYSSGHPYVSHC